MVVAVRDPYDIAHLPGATTYLATYSYTAVAMESLARVLFGEPARAAGCRSRSPPRATRHPLYPFGHGLTW